MKRLRRNSGRLQPPRTRPHQRMAAKSHHGRCGYTLMEVLIASVLIATLMAACWNLMSMYSAFITAGRDKVQERQLARSLFELITDDVQLISLPGRPGPQPPLPGVLPANAPHDFDLPEPFTGAPTTLGDQEFQADATLELVGSGSSLQITFLAEPAAAQVTSDPLAGTELELDVEPITTAGEARTVLYHFEEPNESTELLEQSLPFGLHRIESTAFQLQNAKESGRQSLLDDAASPAQAGFSKLTYDAIFQPVDDLTQALDAAAGPVFEPTHEHAPECVRCEFEYHDGNRWTANWNTRRRRALPHAIRVTLWLASADELDQIDAVLNAEPTVSDEGVLPGIRPRRYQRLITFSASAKPQTDSLGGDQ